VTDQGRRLANYDALVARVDAFSARIQLEFSSDFHCRRGCDSCCRHLSLFAVEGAALRRAWLRLPAPAREEIARRARASEEDGPCPLLKDRACLLYAARPLICRTHGLPLLYRNGEIPQVTFCPLNFQDRPELPGRAVLDMEVVNTALDAVNGLFVREAFPAGDPGRRRPLREFLLPEAGGAGRQGF
jgi:Fe-S-cluster containining protein